MRDSLAGLVFAALLCNALSVSGSLKINEIYLSLQGESTFAGLPCIFIRLTGCNLRCSYCDTAYAFTEGSTQSFPEILERVQELAQPFPNQTPEQRLPLIELTGGEPLLQKESLPLMQLLCNQGFTVLLETSGALDIAPIDPRVRRIVDLKCPGSGESHRNRWDNIRHLRPTDEVKFVVGSVEDYAWMKNIMREYALEKKCPILCSWVAPLSPEQEDPSLKDRPADQHPISRLELVEKIIADALPVRFQLQMHKFIWTPEQRGV